MRVIGLFVIGMELEGQACLVVGGGLVAERKVESLLEAGAKVTVVAPAVTGDLRAMAEAGELTWIRRDYAGGDMEGVGLVMAATDNESVNLQVSVEARERKLPVNVCDRTELCSFVVPAVARQGDLTLAVFTGGRSPMLARRIREELQATYGPEYGQFLAFMGALRPRLAAAVPSQARRRAIYEALVYSDALDLVRQGRLAELEARVEALLSHE